MPRPPLTPPDYQQKSSGVLPPAPVAPASVDLAPVAPAPPAQPDTASEPTSSEIPQVASTPPRSALGTPLKPWTPTIQPDPVPEVPLTGGESQTGAPEVEDDPDARPVNPTIPKGIRGPRRKCPNCLYFPMKPLAEFKFEDIEKTYLGEGEYYYQTRPLLHILPFPGLFLGFASFLGNLLSSKAKDAQNRAKVRRAKDEILERCPNALICPECCQVLELVDRD